LIRRALEERPRGLERGAELASFQELADAPRVGFDAAFERI
jgi:hypothetical protein